ncbi:alpha/beta hydrolase [Actinokineospora enzanensis]|uniref:alpha/beta hydrolase n=1 Tax=Actinokineospora enzanensis TaxID=155975 RepID=UPI0006841156|nr:alpha/beta hydrolase [Actinokineospora enzanensis]
MTRRIPVALPIAALLVLGGGLPAAAAVPDGGTGQAITWHDCRTTPDDELGRQLDEVGARCGELTVPLDYSRPHGRTITLAVARRAATDSAHRLGTLVVNTGGPGPSRDGVSLLATAAPTVAARYDVVSFDPRFFGLSTPLPCAYPTDLYLRSVQLASPDRASFERGVAAARELARLCTGYRDLLPHASTRNIARDMDLVRTALGEERVSYLGWSYGTYLGAVYLQLFPDRANRVVLDSALDPDRYGPQVIRDGAPADAAALRDWAGWAARHDQGLGGTTDQVLAVVTEIDRAATRRPLRVGTHRIDAAMVPGLLLTVDDTDASYTEFSAQVRVLRDAAHGLTVTPTADQEAKLSLYEDPTAYPEFGFAANTTLQCADRAADRNPENYYRDIQSHRTTEPLYGPLTRDITACAFWPTRPAEPPTKVRNNHPALIVSASGDPATPYPGQQALHRALTGSRMLTLPAYRHGVYLLDGAPCVDQTVNRYLLDGTLPATDRTCTRVTPPDAPQAGPAPIHTP